LYDQLEQQAAEWLANPIKGIQIADNKKQKRGNISTPTPSSAASVPTSKRLQLCVTPILDW
jgi:hypothetical protein